MRLQVGKAALAPRARPFWKQVTVRFLMPGPLPCDMVQSIVAVRLSSLVLTPAGCPAFSRQAVY